ncbi:Asp-tRNA(Asn)/Glu-tRNA(Gln) amidotransferase subunit GatA, partial [Patescibacteria group bacterium]|nr:Asp-tRNA(Asn)/Glu-tRNA(Gln) amidotransferase subunit GatA [Patescibacteria group bacterium]
SSTDCMGTLTKTIWDAAAILSVIAGYDPLDATSSKRPTARYEKELGRSYRARIGIPKEFFEGLDKKVAKVVEVALKILEKKGHKLVSISLPHSKYAYSIYAVVQTSEVSSNLARFDGIRYGTGRENFREEAKRRIMIGTHSLSAGYADRYYKQATKGRTLLFRDFDKAFKKVDIIAGPIYPFPPFKHGEREADPLQMYLSDVLTVPANLTGHPGISVPIEFVGNLPNGLQLIAPYFQEKRLFRIGYDVEQELKMYKVKPNLKE